MSTTAITFTSILRRGLLCVALLSTLSLLGAQPRVEDLAEVEQVHAAVLEAASPAVGAEEELLADELVLAGESVLQEAQAAAYIPPVTPAFDVVMFEVTAYCPCTRCCGPQAQGITASGHDVSYNDGRFVAADTTVLPFGTRLVIPGYADETPVEVIDRGGAIKGHKLDVYFDDHNVALQWGRQWVPVRVYR